MSSTVERKDAIWASRRKYLLEAYNIVFEDSIDPAIWPKRHAHIFHTIRAITHKQSPSGIRSAGKSSAKEKRIIRDVAIGARQRHRDNAIEQCWRTLEGEIMYKWMTLAVCEYCGGERYNICYEAEPTGSRDARKLTRKRSLRKQCVCSDDEDFVNDHYRSDVDDFLIFTSQESTRMTHLPGENEILKDYHVPMEPDRTIGLSIPPACQHALESSVFGLEHSPMSANINIMYPFLLIEAKAAKKIVPWEVIEAQTAFPIRRLILLQNELYEREEMPFNPLVWFFGYRGSQWRLYAATLGKRVKKVSVYRLWDGDITKEHYSKQLFHLLGYIYSWARDVYRLQIRDSICALEPQLRGLSPLERETFSRTQSVLSEQSVDAPKSSQLDVIMEDYPDIEVSTSTPAAEQPEQTSHDQIRQICVNQPSPPQLVSLRNVKFSLRFINLGLEAKFEQQTEFGAEFDIALGAYNVLVQVFKAQNFIRLKSNQLTLISRYWLGESYTKEHFTPYTLAREYIMQLYFQTYLDPADFTIVRELTCLAISAKLTRAPVANDVLLCQLKMLRHMNDRTAFTCAVNGTKLALQLDRTLTPGNVRDQPPHWQSHQSDYLHKIDNAIKATASIHTPFTLFSAARSRVIPQLRFPASEWMYDGPVPEDLRLVSEEIDWTGVILLRKPLWWPAACPEHCVFVLGVDTMNDEAQLPELLSTLSLETPVRLFGITTSGVDGYELDLNEMQLITSWLPLPVLQDI